MQQNREKSKKKKSAFHVRHEERKIGKNVGLLLLYVKRSGGRVALDTHSKIFSTNALILKSPITEPTDNFNFVREVWSCRNCRKRKWHVIYFLNLETANSEEKYLFLQKKILAVSGNSQVLSRVMSSNAALNITLNTRNKQKAVKNRPWRRHSSLSTLHSR